MAKDGKLGDVSQQQDVGASDAKALRQATLATDQYTQAMQRQTKAMGDQGQAWGRMRKEQETFLGNLKKSYDVMKQASGGFAGMSTAASNYTNKLREGTTVTAFFARGIDALRKGQTAFAGTMVATTNNISKAMDQSAKYVAAVDDTYRSAHKMSGEYRVETKALQQAVDDLNTRFATQIAVSGDMKGAIEGMRKEALIMSKYLGTSMQDVMDGWNERMQQSNNTLEESRKEMVRVAMQADKYAQEIGKLGDAYLKTGNIGKKEFLDMVRSVGKELKTGTIDAASYARALGGIMKEGKKNLQTVNEQRESAEALKKMMAGMFSDKGTGSIFGMKVAKKIKAQWEDLGNIQNDQLRKRLEVAREKMKDAPELQQLQYIMNVLQGSAAGNAQALRMISQMAGKDMTLQLAKEFGQTNTMIAEGLATGIKNDSIAKDFDEKAAKEDKEGKEAQTSAWKKSIEDLVKASMTPKGRRYKMYAAVHKIQKHIEFLTKSTIGGAVATQAGGLGKDLLMMRLLRGGGAAAGAGGSGGLFSGLFGGGAAATTATGTTAAGGTVATAGAGGTVATVAATTAAVTGAALVGVAVGTLIDHGVGKAIAGGLFGKRAAKIMEKEGDATQSAFVSRKAMSLTHRGDKGWQMIEKERVFMRGQEYAKRKDMVAELAKIIKRMKKNEKDLSAIEAAKLKALKKEHDQIKKTIAKRVKREEKEGKTEDIRLRLGQQKRIGSWMRDVNVKGGTQADMVKQLLKARVGDQTTITREGTVGKDFMAAFSSLSDEQRAKFGDTKKFLQEIQVQLTRRKLKAQADTLKGEAVIDKMTPEELRIAAKRGGVEIEDVGDLTALSQEQQAMEDKRKQLQLLVQGAYKGGDVGAGLGAAADAAAQVVKTNAKGEMVIQLPGQKLVLVGMAPTVAAQNQKQKGKG